MLRSYGSFKIICLSLMTLAPFAHAFADGHTSPRAAGSASTITLDIAVQKAIDADPRLAAGSFQLKAKKGRAQQAAAFPNPEIVMEIENFEGSGDFQGLDQAEVTGTLEQKIELGGKRRHRMTAADSGVDVAAADQETLRKKVAARTTGDFLSVLGADARLVIAQESVTQVNRLLPALRRKTEAGAASDVDLSRGQVALELAVIDRDRAGTNLDAARSQLASNWSGTLDDAINVSGQLNQPSTPRIAFATLAERLASHPLVQRWASMKKQKQADFQYQKAQRVPDVMLGAGARQIRETDDTAFLFSVSLPIPVWNRNQGAIDEARQMLARADAEQRAAEQDLYRQLNSAFGVMTASCGEANRLQSRIIPSASQTLAKLEDGYEQGRFGVLDLLDASKVLAEAKGRHVDSLVNCHGSAAEIQYLTGLNPLFPNTKELRP